MEIINGSIGVIKELTINRYLLLMLHLNINTESNWGSPKGTLTTSELRKEFICRNTISTPVIFCTKGESSSEDSKLPLGLVLNFLYTLMIKTQYLDYLFNLYIYIFQNDIWRTWDLIYVNKCIKGIIQFP